MRIFKNTIATILTSLLLFNNIGIAFAETLYPNYGEIYVGKDKYEKFNRKMFRFNLGLNKYLYRPVHIIWSSILPECAITGITRAYTNIEYPKRLVSTMIQKDYKHSRSETSRFFINTTIGLAGIFDPADKWFHITPVNEDMEQALAKCRVRSGNFLVLPIIATPTNTRNIAGSILDTALNPTTYLFFSGFIITGVKAGLTINRTAKYQPLAKMLESNYADPYDMAKQMYGVQKYIYIENYDRSEVLKEVEKTIENYDDQETDKNIINVSEKKTNLTPDITFDSYNPKAPVTDSLRTALFNKPEVYKSIWLDNSVWNHSFSKKIKTGSIQYTQGRAPYKYHYILQKQKNSPLAILYPSIGEGVNSTHSLYFAKMFYDKGYSVLIMGNHFQWEYVQSMPLDYRPGYPATDVKYMRDITSQIMKNIEGKSKKTFTNKVVLGTSLGAFMTIAIANEEAKDNTMHITKYIAICPPSNLIYAIRQFDKNSLEWRKSSDDLQRKVAYISAKISNAYFGKNVSENDLVDLNFSEYDAKLITGYIMHQKLSDLIYSIENTKDMEVKSALYKQIQQMGFEEYMDKYLISQNPNTNIEEESSILNYKDYLEKYDNYKIYHAVDDYLNSKQQLTQLKKVAGDRLTFVSNGAHLGFLYRSEFQKDLEKEIDLANFK